MKKFIIPKYIVFVGSLSACTATDHSNGVKVTENTISKFANNGQLATFTNNENGKIAVYTYVENNRINIDDINLPQQIRNFNDLSTLSKFLDTVFIKITTNDHQEPVLNIKGKLKGGFVEDSYSYSYSIEQLKKLTLSELKSRKKVLEERRKEFENKLEKLEESYKSYKNKIENIQSHNSIRNNLAFKLFDSASTIGLCCTAPPFGALKVSLDGLLYLINKSDEKKYKKESESFIALYNKDRTHINCDINRLDNEVNMIISLISKY